MNMHICEHLKAFIIFWKTSLCLFLFLQVTPDSLIIIIMNIMTMLIIMKFEARISG